MVAVMFVMLPRAAASATRINRVLDTESEIADPDDGRPAGPQRGQVEFQHVTFR
jgi:ATP-binding cassette subfamily B multidrug efflux pump